MRIPVDFGNLEMWPPSETDTEGGPFNPLVGGTWKSTASRLETERQDRNWKYKSWARYLRGAADAEGDKHLLPALEPARDACHSSDDPELPELLETPDIEELLGLLLAVYPEQMEDNPGTQVHLRMGYKEAQG